MKLRAGRGRRDADDIDRLLDACGIASLADAIELFDGYYPQDEIAAPGLPSVEGAVPFFCAFSCRAGVQGSTAIGSAAVCCHVRHCHVRHYGPKSESCHLASAVSGQPNGSNCASMLYHDIWRFVSGSSL
jgi:hypothetical protein